MQNYKLQIKDGLSATVGLAVFMLALAGCGHKDGEHAGEHGHDHGAGATHGHSHGDDAKSFSGASYKEGEGITLLEQARKLLDVQVQEVQEQHLAKEVRLMARVFSAGEDSETPASNSPRRTLRASGTIPGKDADSLRPGMPVQLSTASGSSLTGRIERVEKIPGAEAEVIVSFPATGGDIGFGDFLQAAVQVTPNEKSAVVPREAVIRGTDGSFVYVVNGNAYLRAPVKTGTEGNDLVEVREGLLAGDLVVSKGALDLWLIELRAVKGGQGCCPAPPAKTKT